MVVYRFARTVWAQANVEGGGGYLDRSYGDRQGGRDQDRHGGGIVQLMLPLIKSPDGFRSIPPGDRRCDLYIVRSRIPRPPGFKLANDTSRNCSEDPNRAEPSCC